MNFSRGAALNHSLQLTRRRLLQAVARKAVGEDEVGHLPSGPDDGVVVHQVHVVGPGPALVDLRVGAEDVVVGEDVPERELLDALGVRTDGVHVGTFGVDRDMRRRFVGRFTHRAEPVERPDGIAGQLPARTTSTSRSWAR